MAHLHHDRRGLAPEWERVGATLLGGAARWLALAGGAMLVALAALTVISVTGRSLVRAGLGPVPGDYELVEAGCAFAIFSFLPWCQLRRAHVTVDLLVGWTGPRVRAALSLASNVLLTGVAVLLAWRLQAGLADKIAYGETTFILQLPIWWAYLAALPGAWLFALISGFTAWRSFNDVASGKGEGAA